MSQNNANISRIVDLQGKIKKLEGQRLHDPSQVVNQGEREEPKEINHRRVNNQLKEDCTEEIATDHKVPKNQIQQMIDEAVQRHFEKESENKRAQGIYNSVNFMAKMLKLNDAQKDEFWPVMLEYYEEYQRIKDGFKGLDKTSRDSYMWQLKQLKERTMQSLKQILSSQQMECLQIHLPE